MTIKALELYYSLILMRGLDKFVPLIVLFQFLVQYVSVTNSCDLYALDQQLLYETCLCIWLLSYYEPAIEYLATSRTMQRLTEVVKSSTKEKVSYFPLCDLVIAILQLLKFHIWYG